MESGDYFGPSLKSKEKSSDALKHFAKNTLRKAGLMPRTNNRKLPQTAPNPQLTRTPETLRKSVRSNPFSHSALSTNDGSTDIRQNSIQIDSDSEEVLSSKSIYGDYLIKNFWGTIY